MKSVDELDAPFKDFLQFQVVIIDLIESQYPQRNELHLLALHLNNTVTQNGCTGVDA